MNALLVFVASCCSVGLGCFQAINVVHGRRLWAIATSLAQGVAALTLYKTVPNVTTTSAAIAFLAGGVAGGQISMHVTRKTRMTPSSKPQ